MGLRFTLTCCLQGLRIKPLTFWSLRIIWITAPLVEGPQRWVSAQHWQVYPLCVSWRKTLKPDSINYCAGERCIAHFRDYHLRLINLYWLFIWSPDNIAFGREERLSFNRDSDIRDTLWFLWLKLSAPSNLWTGHSHMHKRFMNPRKMLFSSAF